MSAPRFYCPPPLPAGANCELPPEAAHHASRVLRLRVGDAVQIFDGLGNALDATLHAIHGKHVLLGNLQTCMPTPAGGLRIVLAQALCGSEKMDWVVQKATELGVAEIIPIQTQRSVAKLAANRADKRALHWHNVAVAACEQCGRNELPQLQAPQSLAEWVQAMRGAEGGKFILLPGGAGGLQAQPKPQGSAILLIGPEGGFTADEANVAQQAGFVPVLLGPRVLRTETAAIAGIAALQTLWGDFN
ncbi:16S rRNA (uracil(1498)-N(3))-methyltransferase [Ferrigenium sp. UT5]|uniref:16S rRNA (uracil(1498)-N(3))-methyltransferase n=1 Tax=Ferrigenium sp. UT5 TaxID=3242105 RepID=UPI00354F047C